ncbi:MAG: ABC transporter ATP-binding protein [Planctomycetota bacterium]
MSEQILRISGLCKDYGRLRAVRDVGLLVGEGEVMGLIAPNGAGKSTLLRMLATTLEPTAGRVFFYGRDIWERLEDYRDLMGFMPDFFQLYTNLTVRQTLRYFGIAHRIPRHELPGRIDEVLDLVGLSDKAETRVQGLSRGMTQRLGLARAVMHGPSLLLLDEPASGLDPLARRRVLAALRRVREVGVTLLISSHILGELGQICTSVGIMDQGRFVEVGPTEAIARKLTPGRQITLRLTGGVETASNLLSARGDVRELHQEDGRLVFQFDGEDAGLAEINAGLVRAGVGVSLLSEARADLHEIYYAIAERQADAPTD